MNVLVAGGSGGLGRSLVTALAGRPEVTQVWASYRSCHPDLDNPKVEWLQADLSEEASVAALFANIDSLDYLINAAGMLHTDEQLPEKSIAKFDSQFFMENIASNTLPTLLLAKYAMRPMRQSDSPVFAALSARIGSIEDNRVGGWYSYRASKAALNMGLKTLAIEWSRAIPGATVAALHPGTNKTRLSEPFQRNVPKEKLFAPDETAAQLLGILAKLEPQDSGKYWSWDGTNIPW